MSNWLALTILFAVAAWAAIMLRSRLLKKDSAGYPHRQNVQEDIQRASEELSNETTKLRSKTRQLSESPDPFRELMKTMLERRKRAKHH
jgi:TolA-binding protein